jgi:DNA repair exonuclease SbcCD ATPase subunit
MDEKILKIRSIGAENFGAFKSFQADIDDSVTYFCGWNGAGKSTAGIDAVWAAMLGIAKRGDAMPGDRFRFIGKYGRSATATLNLEESGTGAKIKIERKILKNSTVLKATASDDRQIDNEYLKGIFSSLFVDLTAFSKLSPIEQAKAIGIDTTKFDEYRNELMLTRREIGRRVKELEGEIRVNGEHEKIDTVDVESLRRDLKQAYQKNSDAVQAATEAYQKAVKEVGEHNSKSARISSDIAICKSSLKNSEMRIYELQEEIKRIQAGMVEMQKTLDGYGVPPDLLPDPKPIEPEKIDTSEIEAKISAAVEQNKQAAAYQKSLDLRDKYDKAMADYDLKTSQLSDNEKARLDHINSKELPFSNITIGEDGGFQVNYRPFSASYFSHGELVKYTAMILASNPPALRYVFIENASLVDPENLAAMLKFLNEHGFQVVCEVVRDRKIDAKSVLLKDMEIVESYEDEAEIGDVLA